MKTNISLIEYRSEQDVRFHLKQAKDDEIVVVSIKHGLGTDYSLAETEPTITGDASKIKYTPLQTLDTRTTMAHVYEVLEDQRDGATLIMSTDGDKVMGIVLWEQLHTILMKRYALA